MNMIDKIIDSQSITGSTLGQPGPVMISLPDFRTRTDSFLNSSTGGFFPDNLFLLNSSLFSRAMNNPSSAFNEMNSNFKLPLAGSNLEPDGDKSSEEEDFCEKCQKRFCNKYYLRKHKIDVHKTECDIIMNPLESGNNIVNDLQHKSSLFQPSIFNPLFNTSFSNFLLQKSIGPMFPNLLLQSPPMPSSIAQQNNEFSLSAVSNPSPVFSQSGFRISQSCSLLPQSDVLSSCSNTFSNNLSALNDSRMSNNIATSMFEDVKNSFMKLPIDSKSFSLDNNFRDQTKPIQAVSCNICGIQLAGGESVLLDHLFACHNKENLNGQSTIPKLLPKKESTPPVNTTNDSYISPFDAFKSSMAAAKLADRVTCDICHKDLCNKYFLRTHKLKLHGVQTIDSTGRTGNRKEKTGFYERCNNPIDTMNSAPSFIGSPFSRNPIPDPMLAASLFTNSSKPRPGSPETGCFCPICKRLISLPYFLPLHMWNAHGIGMGSHNSILNSVCNSRSNVDPNLLEPPFMSAGLQSKINPSLFPLPFCNNGLDSTNLGSKWYRKSPNQMRVRCDICDKWICNKYFLRTHKLNKHGLTDNGSNTDVNSDSVSRNFFIDSSTVPNTSSTGTDPSDNQINMANPTIENDGSPIDLSSSPLRNIQHPQSSVNTSISNSDKPLTVSSSQTMPGFNLNSLWGSRMNFPWSLRLSMDRINLPSALHSNSRSSAPLDLSMKTEDYQTVKLEPSCVKPSPERNSYNYRSVLLNAAKRLKVKYQKIYRSRYIQNAFLSSRKSCQFLNQSSPSAGTLDCLSCPLCGKELNDAASFLQHLTQFHDMVLPGNHSNSVADVCPNN